MRHSPDPSQPKTEASPDDVRRAGQGLVFGAAAEIYEHGRPGYPSAAAEWLVSGADTVADVGAGTGKFTRELVGRAKRVVAVDPDAAMLQQLHRVLPDVETLVGSAENIPMPDSSVDAITVAQAWHWVDLDLAVPEAVRVLRPGGTLGLIWNVRDESREWVAQLGDLIHRGASNAQMLDTNDPIVGAPFGPLDKRSFQWVHTMSMQQFLDMIASRSYVIAMGADERAELLAASEEHILSQPGQSREAIRIPYVTHAYRTIAP